MHSRMKLSSQLHRDFSAELVQACVEHLFSLLGSDGKFTYAHKHLERQAAYSGYNLLRHCGTVWFMCKAIGSLSLKLDSARIAALRNAVTYIAGKTKKPTWMNGLAPTLCLTSKDVVKIGGVGLAALMVRELSSLAATAGPDLLDSLYPEGADVHCTRLENYALSQLGTEDFVHKRRFSDGDILPFRSDYYTGEVLFALVTAPRFVPAVRSVMESLFERDYGIPEQSHWMAYASCAALKAGYCDQEKTIGYIERLVDRIIADTSYRQRHQSTPIACRSEALVEFLLTQRQLAGSGMVFAEALVERARETFEENLSLQLEYYGEGQFRKGRESDKVQIDYIQHNGAAFLGWWLLGSG